MVSGTTHAACLLVASPAPAAAAAVSAAPAPVGHCHVPWGIYGDMLGVDLLLEHMATIEKAMDQIEAIGATDKPNWNQLVRWVTTKDSHAQEIQDQVSAYWLAQRIKAPTGEAGTEAYAMAERKYMTQLMMAHRLTTFAMKCKQTTDATNVANLRASLETLKGAYFSPEDLEHHKSHSHK